MPCLTTCLTQSASKSSASINHWALLAITRGALSDYRRAFDTIVELRASMKRLPEKNARLISRYEHECYQGNRPTGRQRRDVT